MKIGTRARHEGNTLSEYAMLLGFIALTSIFGLRMLGNANADLQGAVPNAQGTLMNMMNLDYSGPSLQLSPGAVSLKGGGYYVMSINPQTNKPELTFTEQGSGSVTNATSIDGSQWNILGQFHLADSLMKLADQQTDPANADYIRQLAKMSYYLAGAEGEIDGIKGLEQLSGAGDLYGKMNGYSDILRLQQSMQDLLGHPPASLAADTLGQVFGLSTDVYNIAQTYAVALQPAASMSPYGFKVPSDLTAPNSGTPGQILSVSTTALQACQDLSCGTPPSMGGPKIEDMLSITQLKKISSTLLSANQVDISEPVVTTFTKATTIDNTPATPATASTTPAATQ